MGLFSKSKKTGTDLKLDKVRILFSTGRRREAIAYLYLIYTRLSQDKFGVGKKYSQTIRDYAIVMVKEMKQNPQKIYPFIQKVERAVYGGIPTTENVFNDVVHSFKVLYTDLTGKSMPSF